MSRNVVTGHSFDPRTEKPTAGVSRSAWLAFALLGLFALLSCTSQLEQDLATAKHRKRDASHPLNSNIVPSADAGFEFSDGSARDPDAGVLVDADTDPSGLETLDASLNLDPHDGIPVLLSRQPQNQAADVVTTTSISLIFDEPVQAGRGNFLLYQVFDTVTEATLSADDPGVQIEDNKVVIHFASDLAYATEYGLIVDKGAIVSVAGFDFEGLDEQAYTFKTEAPAPIVLTAVSPQIGATDIALDTSISLTFSTEIHSGPLGELTLSEADSGQIVQTSSVNGQDVTIEGKTLTLRLTTALSYDTEYLLTLSSGAIRSADGAVFDGLTEADGTFFTTLPPPPPTLQSTAPQSGQTDVDPTANLVLAFNEPIQIGEGNLIVKNLTDNTEFETVDLKGEGVTLSDVSLTVDLLGTLENSTAYYVTVQAGAVQSSLGADFPGFQDTNTFSFTTAAAPPPPLRLMGSIPADDATDVVADQALVLIFSEAVVKGSGSVTIFRGADDTVFDPIRVDDSRVSIEGDTVTLTLSNPLEGNTDYYVIVGSGAFISVSGAAFPGVLTSDALNFTSDDPFVLLSLVPPSGTQDVTPDVTVELNFSADVEPRDGSLSVYRATDDSLVGSIDVTSAAIAVNANSLQVDLSSLGLAYEMDYYLTLDDGAVGEVGGYDFPGISGSNAWTFTTVTACDTAEVLGPRDKCYFASESLATWDVAQTACDRGAGWSLVSIPDAATQTFVEGLVTKEMWIGASDLALTDKWRWTSDGTQFWQGDQFGDPVSGSYENWKSDQPTGNGQHCARILGSGNHYQWADANCDDEHGFICEGPAN